MGPNVYIVLVVTSFAILYQVHRVSTIECGTMNSVRPDILGVTDTVKGEWPFIVAVQKHSAYICGGTIISNRHILTVAHCIQKKFSEIVLSPHEIVVRLGAYNLSNTNEHGIIQSTVSAIHVHPDWDVYQWSFDADIAILVLSKNITFTNYIQPVCMPANGVIDNMEGRVIAYGVVGTRRNYAEIPRQIIVTAVNNSRCFREDAVISAYSSDRTFCGGTGDGNLHVGDSGSGFFLRHSFFWAQYGILTVLRTNSSGHVYPHGYHLYTNLTMYKDWIFEILNQTEGVVGEAELLRKESPGRAQQKRSL